MQFIVRRPLFVKNGKVKIDSIIEETEYTSAQVNHWVKSGYISAIKYDLKPVEKVNPVIVTGMWKRHDVFKIFKRHYQALGIDVIVAGSEGSVSRKLCEGFTYLETPNQPLAEKMNATTIKALEMGYSHVICVGSDDLLTKELIERYIQLAEKGYDFIGVTDFYFYDLKTRKALYWGGYRERYRYGHTCGAGRMISDRMLIEWDGRPWTNDLSDYLDTAMQNKLKNTLLPRFTFSLKNENLLAVDIKSDENMTPFAQWDNSFFVDPKPFEKMICVE